MQQLKEVTGLTLDTLSYDEVIKGNLILIFSLVTLGHFYFISLFFSILFLNSYSMNILGLDVENTDTMDYLNVGCFNTELKLK